MNDLVATGGEAKVKGAKRAAATTLVTLSKQPHDTTITSSISLQGPQETKGTLVANAVIPRNQEYQAAIIPGSTVLPLPLNHRQSNPSSQTDTTPCTFPNSNNLSKESEQKSCPALSSFIPNKRNSVHQQYPDDLLDIPSHSPALASLTSVTTTEASPIFSGNSDTHDPPAASINSETGNKDQATIPIRLASRPRHKLLRPTSCTSLRQTAFHQMQHSPSPKTKHCSLVFDPTISNDQYHQSTINRSNTFNHVPQLYSPYRRSSGSTLDDTLVTPNSENDDDIDDGIGLRYYMDRDYYYYDDDEEDDDQTLFSSSALSIDSIKPPISPPPPPRKHSKRPTSLICQRLPESHYIMDPSTCHRRQHPAHYSHHFDHHHHQQHSGVASMDLRIPYTDTDGYHTMPNTDGAASIPVSPGSTGSGPYHPSRPYIVPDSACFNKKTIKSHYPQKKQQNSRQSTSQRRHLSMDLLKQELESERAVVYALQRQKDAYNKDITYLCQNVDVLAKEEQQWKAKFQQEKAEKERCQDDLSVAIDRFNEALGQIKQLTNEKERLQLDLEHANHQLSSKNRNTSAPICITGTSNNHQPHQDEQIKLIQTTMEQLLQLNLFGRTRCTITTTGSVDERKRDQDDRIMARTNNALSSISGQQHQRQPSATRHKSRSTSTKQNTSTIVNKDNNNNNSSSSPGATLGIDSIPRITVSSTDLDDQLQRLLQEKELLLAEYSKIPVSGGSAICRRRREDMEARLDEVDSKLRKIRLKIRCRHKRLVV
ncbi:unnamed protein product [Absidia cylindrospora]